jgi:hypothetical protein
VKFIRNAGSTGQTFNIFVVDSSSTTGAGLTGLAYNTAGLTCYYMLPRAAATAVTLATLTAVTSAYSSGGFKEIDATNAPGWYRFDPPDAALAAGNAFVYFHIQGAANMTPLPIEVDLGAPAAIADATLSRDASNVEGTAPEHSLCGVILATTEWAIAGTAWTIYRSDGATTFATKSITVTGGQVTGVA